VEPDANSRGPFYRFNLAERQVYFSAFHLSPRNAARYVEPLVRHGIVWATGYTHSFEQLAGFMVEQGIPAPPKLRAIITTSEKLSEEGRRLIERAFGCRVFQEWGMVEDAAWACEDPSGRLRVSPDAGILELLSPSGSPVALGEPGRVVATSFIRRTQIFLRYAVGDLATLAHDDFAEGPGFPVLKEIVGRMEDLIVGPDGRRTVRFHGVFTEVDGVREAQLVQEAVDRIRIRVVPSPSYSSATDKELASRVRQRLGDSVSVLIEVLDRIPRTRAGKFRAVVSLLSDPDALRR